MQKFHAKIDLQRVRCEDKCIWQMWQTWLYLRNATVLFQQCSALFLTVWSRSKFKAKFGMIQYTVSCVTPGHTSRVSFSYRIFLDGNLHSPNPLPKLFHIFLIWARSVRLVPVINLNSSVQKLVKFVLLAIYQTICAPLNFLNSVYWILRALATM